MPLRGVLGQVFLVLVRRLAVEVVEDGEGLLLCRARLGGDVLELVLRTTYMRWFFIGRCSLYVVGWTLVPFFNIGLRNKCLL